MTDTIYVSTKTINDFNAANNDLNPKDWLGLVALFLSALVAVLIGQWLQNIKSKKDRIYQNKFTIFANLLGLRHARASNENFVICINQIPIVFHDNKNIIESLNKFIATHKEKASTNDEINDRDKRLSSILNDLVIKMAIDLNYSNIDNDLMQNPYNPAASSNRYSSDSVRDELYWLENYPRLEKMRNNGVEKNEIKDQQDHLKSN